jgi:MFS superfamily sulfate permease-like transporter
MTVLGSRTQDAISTSVSIIIVIALLEAHCAGLLRRESWLSNVVSGVIVGVVALSLAMMFAIFSGAKREQGLYLYAAIVAGSFVSTLAAADCRSPGRPARSSSSSLESRQTTASTDRRSRP